MMKAKQTVTKPQGYLLTSKMVKVSSSQEAWSDVVTFDCPVVGVYDEAKVRAALQNKYYSPGSIIGSSYGSVYVYFQGYDPQTKMVRFSLSYGIGE